MKRHEPIALTGSVSSEMKTLLIQYAANKKKENELAVQVAEGERTDETLKNFAFVIGERQYYEKQLEYFVKQT